MNFSNSKITDIGRKNSVKNFIDQIGGDVTIFIENENENMVLKCHKHILSCRSDYFRALFKYQEGNKISIKDFDCHGVKNVINFIYGCKIDIDLDNVCDILESSIYLQVDELVLKAKMFIKKNIDMDSCLSIYQFTSRINTSDISGIALSFILENFNQIMKSKSFLEADHDTLIDILSSPTLCIDSEVALFDAALDWLKFDENRLQYCYSLISKIKLLEISIKKLQYFLTNEVIKRDLIAIQLIGEVIDHFSNEEKESYHHLNSFHLTPRVSYQILSVGGCNRKNEIMQDVELYDRLKGAWTFPSKLPEKRYYFGATECQGNLVVIGGLGPCQFFSSVIMYSPSKRSWTSLPDLPEARRGCGVASIGSKIYTCGGRTSKVKRRVTRVGAKLETMKSVVVLDIGSCGEWKKVDSMIKCRWDHVTCSLNGSIYCIGGAYGNTPLQYCEKFEPETNTWESISSLPHKRYRFAASVNTDYIYVAGGVGVNGLALNSIEQYNPKTNQWVLLTQHLISPRFLFGMTWISNKLYIFGGSSSNSSRPLGYVEMFDPDTKICKFIGQMDAVRYGNAVVKIKF